MSAGAEDLVAILVRHRVVEPSDIARVLQLWSKGPLDRRRSLLDILADEAGVSRHEIDGLLERTGGRLAGCPRCERLFVVRSAGTPHRCEACGIDCRWLDSPADATTRSEQGTAPAGKRYSKVRLLGSGGMGEVYLARDLLFNREVALKTLRLDRAGKAIDLQRFEREATLLARLQHPNVVTVFDLDLSADPPYIVMEYVEGETFESFLSGAFERRAAVRILAQATRGVAAAHEKGIVHRDLKPANILVGSHGAVKVTDFGLARETASETQITQAPTRLGTPAYMAPEQLDPALGSVGPATDVYAMGIILHRILYRRFPYDEKSLAAVHRFAFSPDDALPVPAGNTGLDRVCFRALRRDPSKRYPAASDFLADMTTARGVSSVRFRPSFSRNRWWLPAGIALLALVLSVTAAAIRSSPSGEDAGGRAGVESDDPQVAEPGGTPVDPALAAPAVTLSEPAVLWRRGHGLEGACSIVGPSNGKVVLAGRGPDEALALAAFDADSGDRCWMRSGQDLDEALGGRVLQCRVLDEFVLAIGAADALGIEIATGEVLWRLSDHLPAAEGGSAAPPRVYTTRESILLGHPRSGWVGYRRGGHFFARTEPPIRASRPVAFQQMNSVVAMATVTGGLVIADSADASRHWESSGRSLERYEDVEVDLDARGNLAALRVAQELGVADWQEKRWLFQRTVPMGARLLGLDSEAVCLSVPAREGLALLCLSCASGEELISREGLEGWLLSSKDRLHAAFRDGDAILVQEFSSGRPQGHPWRSAGQEKFRSLTDLREDGIAIQVGNRLLGLDPDAREPRWIYQPIEYPTGALAAAGPGRVVLLDGARMVMLDIAR
ncbi:MAG: serine/threonine protein kinase [Planctomycetes bacterium]|nr:serine/threonine protein kinase [Planctomycetota bacterium]